MRGKKRVFASIDLKSDEIDLLIVKKGFTGIKTLISETFSKEELPLVSQKIKKYRPGEVILLLPQERTIVRDVSLPKVKKDKIKSTLYFELSGTLPYSMEQVNLDYIIVEKSKKELRVKAFVTPEQFKRELAFLREGGITVTRLIPRGLAITAFLQKEGRSELVKLDTPQGHLLLYSDYEQYFSQFYYEDHILTESEIEGILEDKGIKSTFVEPVEINDCQKVLLGAVYLIRNYRTFNLLGERVERSSSGSKMAVIVLLVAILAVNFGTLYFKYRMTEEKLEVYQERLEILNPRTKEVEQLKRDYSEIRKEFENLEQVYEERKDYLVWLKELHLLLQEDTEVQVLVFEDNLLQQLRGKAPQATKVTKRLNNSSYFENPEFVSPITPKEVDGKVEEQFSITAELTTPTGKGEVRDE